MLEEVSTGKLGADGREEQLASLLTENAELRRQIAERDQRGREHHAKHIKVELTAQRLQNELAERDSVHQSELEGANTLGESLQRELAAMSHEGQSAVAELQQRVSTLEHDKASLKKTASQMMGSAKETIKKLRTEKIEADKAVLAEETQRRRCEAQLEAEKQAAERARANAHDASMQEDSLRQSNLELEATVRRTEADALKWQGIAHEVEVVRQRNVDEGQRLGELQATHEAALKADLASCQAELTRQHEAMVTRLEQAERAHSTVTSESTAYVEAERAKAEQLREELSHARREVQEEQAARSRAEHEAASLQSELDASMSQSASFRVNSRSVEELESELQDARDMCADRDSALMAAEERLSAERSSRHQAETDLANEREVAQAARQESRGLAELRHRDQLSVQESMGRAEQLELDAGQMQHDLRLMESEVLDARAQMESVSRDCEVQLEDVRLESVQEQNQLLSQLEAARLEQSEHADATARRDKQEHQAKLTQLTEALEASERALAERSEVSYALETELSQARHLAALHAQDRHQAESMLEEEKRRLSDVQTESRKARRLIAEAVGHRDRAAALAQTNESRWKSYAQELVEVRLRIASAFRPLVTEHSFQQRTDLV